MCRNPTAPVFLGIWGPGRATFGVFVCLALRNFNKAFDINPASGILSGKTGNGSPGKVGISRTFLAP